VRSNQLERVAAYSNAKMRFQSFFLLSASKKV